VPILWDGAEYASPLAQGRGLKRVLRSTPDTLLQSPLAQGRGLKPAGGAGGCRAIRVAPRAGAWIETCFAQHARYIAASPLAQGRGLKQP